MHVLSSSRVLASLCLLVVLALSPSVYAHGRTTSDSQSREMYGIEVSAWGRFDQDGNVLEVGATIPMAAIEGARDSGQEPVFPSVPAANVPFPEEVRQATGFEFVGIHWEPAGHPPEVYSVPHFDFHFYTVPMDEVEAVDCRDHTVPKENELPEEYVMPPVDQTCVPGMGMHALPLRDLQATEPFRETFLMGYYGGKPTFYEPMITLELLLQKESYSYEVPTLEASERSNRHPTTFSARYDAEMDAYHLVFGGFSLR